MPAEQPVLLDHHENSRIRYDKQEWTLTAPLPDTLDNFETADLALWSHELIVSFLVELLELQRQQLPLAPRAPQEEDREHEEQREARHEQVQRPEGAPELALLPRQVLRADW